MRPRRILCIVGGISPDSADGLSPSSILKPVGWCKPKHVALASYVFIHEGLSGLDAIVSGEKAQGGIQD